MTLNVDALRRAHGSFGGGVCQTCDGLTLWPCDIVHLLDALAAEQARVADLRDALLMWDKFRWYATGDSGNTPITMPLWQALVFEEAAKRTAEALAATQPNAPGLGVAGEGVRHEVR